MRFHVKTHTLVAGVLAVMLAGADGRAQTPVGKAMKVTSLAEPKWAEADTADALVAAFRANPKHKSVASKVTDDDLRVISVHVRRLASAE